MFAFVKINTESWFSSTFSCGTQNIEFYKFWKTNDTALSDV